METAEALNVGSVVNQIISRWEQQKSSRHAPAAILAALRNSIGKPMDQAQEVWPLLFEVMPPSFLSTNGKATYQENAVLVTLQLYAVAMQGGSQNVRADAEYHYNIGRSLSVGRGTGDSQALDRRFNAMTAAGDFTALAYHLRQLFKLVKSKHQMTVNFGMLGNDLFYYQLGSANRICFRWAEGYYGGSAAQPSQETTVDGEIEEGKQYE